MPVQVAQNVIDRLVEDMVRGGIITADQLAVARVSQKNLGEDLGQILIKKGFISQDQMLTFLGKAIGISYVSPRQHDIQTNLVQKVPLHVARRYHVIPIKEENGKVIVAMADPLDRFALDDVRASLHAEILPVLASTEEIDILIDRYYSSQKSVQKTDEDATGISERIDYTTEDAGENEGKIENIASGPRIVQSVHQIILDAFKDKASDIHIEPRRDSARVRYRVDGFLEERQLLAKELYVPIVSRIKIMAGLDIAERRIPQDGRVRLKVGSGGLDLRVSTCPTLYGEKVVMRLLSKDAVISIESLGFCEPDRKIFTDLITKSHGIFLVTGPTGSGKSTTLYAALSRINSPEKNIISIEDPVESEVPGVNQAQINMKAGLTFAATLRSILRQDPDVIMIGEIRDSETAEIAVRAAITGHLVLSTLHTNTAAGAVSRLSDLGVPRFMISTALIGVLAQRLVRKICPKCRHEVEFDPTRLGPLEGRIHHVFRGKGCPACRMSGFVGRVGVFELAPTAETVRKAIASGASDTEVEKELRKIGVRSMLEDGIDKINQGVTSVDEVLRVTQEE